MSGPPDAVASRGSGPGHVGDSDSGDPPTRKATLIRWGACALVLLGLLVFLVLGANRPSDP